VDYQRSLAKIMKADMAVPPAQTTLLIKELSYLFDVDPVVLQLLCNSVVRDEHLYKYEQLTTIKAAVEKLAGKKIEVSFEFKRKQFSPPAFARRLAKDAQNYFGSNDAVFIVE
jgi:hypothetical protein